MDITSTVFGLAILFSIISLYITIASIKDGIKNGDLSLLLSNVTVSILWGIFYHLTH